MKKFWAFLKSRFLWINVLIAAVIAVVLWFGVQWWLDSYTHHGESVQVPSVIGMNESEAELLLRDLSLGYEVIDSLHNKRLKPGEIAEQVPAPESFVKRNRKVYITVNAKSKRTLLFKDYRGYSFRKAQTNYRNLGFTADDVKFVPSEYSGEVLEIESEGKVLKAGDKIKEGAVLRLVVGQAGGDMKVLMPSFHGMRYADAVNLMKAHKFIEGAFNFDETVVSAEDNKNFFVYGQEPKEGTMVVAGKNIDLYFSKDKNKEYKSVTTSEEDFF